MEPHSFHWVSAGRTELGKVRKLNEDALLQRPDRGLWAVADGMGGHAAGDFASASVVSALGGIREGLPLEPLIAEARQQLERINGELLVEGRQRRARIIGSTVVVLVAAGHEGAVLWAGDSRLYRWRGRRLERLTDDHSRIQELIASGRLDADQAEQHPEANVITRAVGVAETLELSNRRFPIRDGDTFLLCSDGLTRYVSDRAIASALRDPTCQGACDRLIEAALKSPARDNITVVVTRASSDDSQARTVLNPAVARDDDATEPRGATTVLDSSR
ncbi:MAG TPA: protein phosphatase 2C domain-containing protein [Pseudomonadales bacterium]